MRKAAQLLDSTNKSGKADSRSTIPQKLVAYRQRLGASHRRSRYSAAKTPSTKISKENRNARSQGASPASVSTAIAIAAAGHAAGYALNLAVHHPTICAKLALVAPTWRGPLAVMGAPSTVRSGVKELVRTPLLGQALYSLNTHPAFLKWMYRRHVFVDEQRLTPDYIQQRHQSTQQPGARCFCHRRA